MMETRIQGSCRVVQAARSGGGRGVLAGLLAGMLACGLAGCAGKAMQSGTAHHTAIQDFAGAPAGGASREDGRVKTNLPSAPADTPLCGAALHEQASTGASLYDRSLQTGNGCTRNACFQPLTGTFIAQDGTNSVCR